MFQVYPTSARLSSVYGTKHLQQSFPEKICPIREWTGAGYKDTDRPPDGGYYIPLPQEEAARTSAVLAMLDNAIRTPWAIAVTACAAETHEKTREGKRLRDGGWKFLGARVNDLWGHSLNDGYNKGDHYSIGVWFKEYPHDAKELAAYAGPRRDFDEPTMTQRKKGCSYLSPCSCGLVYYENCTPARVLRAKAPEGRGVKFQFGFEPIAKHPMAVVWEVPCRLLTATKVRLSAVGWREVAIHSGHSLWTNV